MHLLHLEYQLKSNHFLWLIYLDIFKVYFYEAYPLWWIRKHFTWYPVFSMNKCSGCWKSSVISSCKCLGLFFSSQAQFLQHFLLEELEKVNLSIKSIFFNSSRTTPTQEESKRPLPIIIFEAHRADEKCWIEENMVNVTKVC